MKTYSARQCVVAVALAGSLSACGGDAAMAPAPNVVGSYHATVFTAGILGGTLDILAAGGSLVVTLATNHTTTGKLIIPATVTNGFPIDQNLDGTWSQAGSTVHFTSNDATIVQDVAFKVKGTTLVAEQDVSGAHIKVTLARD